MSPRRSRAAGPTPSDPERPAPFEPVARGPRLSDQVADRLLDSILERGLRQGDRLPSERELGQLFGVSRTVVREAVRSLAARGIIEARSGSGLMVAQVDASAVSQAMNLYLRGIDELPYAQVHEVRAMVEVQVAGLAAESTDEVLLGELRAAHERMARQVERRQDYAEADVEFHRCLARLTGNPLYLLLLDSIGDVLLEVRREISPLTAEAPRAVAQHAAVLDRVAAADADGAREAMRTHLETAAEIWRRVGHPVGAPAAGTAG